MSRIRVLLVLHELSLSGAPKVILDAFEELQDHIDLLIVSATGGPLEERCRALGPLWLVPDFWKISTRLLRVIALLPVRSAVRRWKPDVIYINSVASLRIMPALRLPDAPIVLHIHELEAVLNLFSRSHEAWMSHMPQTYIAASEPVRTALERDYQVPPDKIRVIHEFVPEADYRREPVSLPSRDGRFVVGGAGRPDWRKGGVLWLQMAVHLKRILGPGKVRCVWVGVPEDRPGADNLGFQFREIARKLDVLDVVEFVLLTSEPLRHFAEFDVFAMTSWEDPCPIVVLESMMLRKPVLCFAGSGGAPEEVGETGVVIDGFSSETMAEKIAELASDPDRRAALGEAARSRIGTHFVSSVQAPKIWGEIQLLAQRKLSPPV